MVLKSSAAKLYISVYNLVQFFGWASVICLTLDSVGRNRGGFEVYEKVGWLVKCLQLLSTMELVHCSVGLAGGSPVSVFVQLFGRDMILFAVLDNESNSQKLVVPLFLTWATIEVIRYPFYQLSTILGRSPAWLTRLRYSAFIPLYPLGILAEIRCLQAALPFLAKQGPFNVVAFVPLALIDGRAKILFSLHRLLRLLSPLYLVLGPTQYIYMFGQRKKKVSALPPSQVSVVRAILGFLIGAAVAVVTIEVLSNYTTDAPETMKDGATVFKPGDLRVYAPVLSTWALGAFLGGAVSGAVTKTEIAPLEVGFALMLSIIANLMSIPSPLWVWLCGVGCVIPMALAGHSAVTRLSIQRSS